jgi:hypothetical protein
MAKERESESERDGDWFRRLREIEREACKTYMRVEMKT